MHEKQTATPHTLPSLPEKPKKASREAIPQRATNEAQTRLQIRTLNEVLRSSFIGGHIVFTHGIQQFEEDSFQSLIERIQQFNDFTPENDPYGERDFGSMDFQNEKVFWKIDYYNKDMTGGSEHPEDPSVTSRVLTIMLASEY